MILLFDVNNVASRCFHARPALVIKEKYFNAIEGFLEQVRKLRDLYGANRLAFCFDSKTYIRRRLHRGYKAIKDHPFKARGVDSSKDKKHLICQLNRLREDILPAMGFTNVFQQEGYEADDLIAWLCQHFLVRDAVIVSSDKDLFQCLRNDPGKVVKQHTFNDLVTVNSFYEKYGVSTKQWAMIKAIAGCDGDGVTGVRGVGEVTAAKYLNGKLSDTTQAVDAIKRSKDIIERNLKLVTLPLDGVEEMDILEDADTPASWVRVLKRIGLERTSV